MIYYVQNNKQILKNVINRFNNWTINNKWLHIVHPHRPLSTRFANECYYPPTNNLHFGKETDADFLLLLYHAEIFFIECTYLTSCMSVDTLRLLLLYWLDAWIPIISRWSWSSATNTCTSLFTSLQVQADCFFTPLSPSLLFKILTKTPTSSSSIDRCW